MAAPHLIAAREVSQTIRGHGAVVVNGETVPRRVVFGKSGDAVLLGLTVLEQLGLAVAPVQRRIIPTDFLLH